MEPKKDNIIRYRSFHRYFVCREHYYEAHMKAFFENPDAAVENPSNRFLKRGRASTVAVITIGNRSFVVKRYNIKGLGHGLRRAFMTTRAARSWKSALRLKSLGILTPEPVGFLEKRFGPFRNKAYFINEFLNGPRAVDFFKGTDTDRTNSVAPAIAAIFDKLRSARISHGDMKATNIIIHKGEPALVDLDAMRSHSGRKRFLRAHEKDLERFFRNWKDFPGTEELFEDLLRKYRTD